MRMPFVIVALLAATPVSAEDACLSEVTQLAAKNERIKILHEVKRELELYPAMALGLALLGPLVAAQHEQRVAIAEAEARLKALRDPAKCREELLELRVEWFCPWRDTNFKAENYRACQERVFAELFPEAGARVKACPDPACKKQVYAETLPDSLARCPDPSPECQELAATMAKAEATVARGKAAIAGAKEALAKAEASKAAEEAKNAAEEAKAMLEAASRKAAEDAWAARATRAGAKAGPQKKPAPPPRFPQR